MTGRLLAYLLDTKRLIPGKPMQLMFPMRDTSVDYLDPSYKIYQTRCSARAWIQLRFHSHCRVDFSRGTKAELVVCLVHTPVAGTIIDLRFSALLKIIHP
ncbi:hypothetical protein TRV_03501 [Trichophyton verrucosum HKI 0517]|uniref:Uncharacterized protein n=1 Tax=Trichophyton verrucosum (strain HKI 0517) TaxID=663202 RepID=D4D8R3_TRIVH|nr:uncharacterized protein TRV_03501 [Trichophyton verrucosum HKI 0517]EFE41756.1 hypothetical protein TRV_03501 [Trichophyton verrucosum HKI 0517]